MSPTYLLALVLVASPPTLEDATSEDAPTATEAREHSYEAGLARVSEASLAASNDTDQTTLDELEDAIANAASFTAELSADARGRKEILGARLNLIRGTLHDHPARAEELAEELARGAIGILIPPKYGPRVSQLMSDTRARMVARGIGTIEVDCATRCVVAVDTYPMSSTSIDVYLGPHQIRIWSLDSDYVIEHSLEVTVPGEIVSLSFVPPEEPEPEPEEPAPEPPPPSVVDLEPSPIPPAHDVVGPARLLPRGVEIGAMAIGIGLGIAGGVLWTYDGRCQDGSANTSACPRLWDSTKVSGAMVGVGGALALSFGIVLAIDERRSRSKSKLSRHLGRDGTLRF